MVRIIAFAGSLRKNSFNKKLVKIAAQGAEDAGALVQLVDLADFDIPLFSEDIETGGIPADVIKLKRLFVDKDGLLISSPEYNGSIPGVLKNALDWLSRPDQAEKIGQAFRDKTVAIMATSPGGLGGIRGLSHVRDVMFNLGMNVIPKQLAIPSAAKAFDDMNQLIDKDMESRVKGLGVQLVKKCQR